MGEWIGYQWLAEHYAVEPVQAFRTRSAIGRMRRSEQQSAITTRETYTAVARPSADLAGHLTFALRHETLNLEFLARLFDVVPTSELEQWIASEPTGQYVRRACFLFEWLTGRRLSYPGVTAGNYVQALDPDRYVTAVKPVNNPRWRVRDNLPGTANFCPLVVRTPRIRDAESFDCAARLSSLEKDFGQDLLMRSAVWLTMKESRASFAIEHEAAQQDRIQRFASVMARLCGNENHPLSTDTLGTLQREILGARATRYGIRRSPVFVGETRAFGQWVHYIAPHWDDLANMLTGLQTFEQRTQGASPLVRAAVLSFGFVYLHPMSDGNGRISRFLINDTLRRDGAVPAPYVLPVSATIMHTDRDRRSYDQALESFSEPLMQRYRDSVQFGRTQVGEDGVEYDIEFGAWGDAQFAWRFPDLTTQAEYLADVIVLTLEREIRDEARTLRAFHVARAGIKEHLEGPDSDIDRIIRSIRENNGIVSKALRKQFPLLEERALAEQIVKAISTAFGDHA